VTPDWIMREDTYEDEQLAAMLDLRAKAQLAVRTARLTGTTRDKNLAIVAWRDYRACEAYYYCW
jgi:hypothetical protein